VTLVDAFSAIGLPRAQSPRVTKAAAALRRLAIFWLVCAATGFAAAAALALLLSLAVDDRPTWRRPMAQPVARLMERLQSHPHNTLDAMIGE
jgi:hypothetical protein